MKIKYQCYLAKKQQFIQLFDLSQRHFLTKYQYLIFIICIDNNNNIYY